MTPYALKARALQQRLTSNYVSRRALAPQPFLTGIALFCLAQVTIFFFLPPEAAESLDTAVQTLVSLLHAMMVLGYLIIAALCVMLVVVVVLRARVAQHFRDMLQAGVLQSRDDVNGQGLMALCQDVLLLPHERDHPELSTVLARAVQQARESADGGYRLRLDHLARGLEGVTLEANPVLMDTALSLLDRLTQLDWLRSPSSGAP